MNIVAGTSRQTVLNSLLDEAAFGKIQYMMDLNENGFVAEASMPFSHQMHFDFSEWKFNGTETEEKSGQVLFTGPAFDGRSFLGIIEDGNKDEKTRAVFSYSVAVSQAAAEGIKLPANGAGGILYSETKTKIRLLFLPQGIFEIASHNAAAADYAEIQGVWQDKNLVADGSSDKNARALSFTRAVMVYYLLTESLPFAAENQEVRQSDIVDAKYLPLKNKINGIDENISEQISSALEGRTDIKISLSALQAELGFCSDGSVEGVKRRPKVSDEEFEAAAKKYFKQKTVRVKAGRTLRRNRALFIAGVVLIAASLFFGRSVHNDKLHKPTTISLSPRETAEVYFGGMHRLDTQTMQYASKGRAAQSVNDSVSNIYVASKMRDAFAQINGTLTPEFWLYRSDLHDRWIFGLTQFMIGDDAFSLTPADNRKSAPSLKDNPLPLKEKDGSKTNVFVSYYRIHSEGPDTKITAEKFSGSVELTFIKNRWLVTGFDLSSASEEWSAKLFEDDYRTAIAETGGDSISAARILSSKYDWIPTDKEMHSARIEDETKKAAALNSSFSFTK